MPDLITPLTAFPRLGLRTLANLLAGRLVRPGEIAQSYDRVSAGYRSTYLKKMHEYNDQLLELLCRRLDSSAPKILDLAGGDGYNCERLRRRIPGAELTLLDLSPGMLDRCRLPGVQRICSGMIDYLGRCAPGQYDAILCTWALMYEQPRQVLAGCARALRPGGLLGILVNDRRTLPQIRRAFPGLLAEYAHEVDRLMLDLPTPRSAGQLCRWGKAVGLRPLCAREKVQNFRFATHGQAARFVTSTGALAGYDQMLDLRRLDIQASLVERLARQGEPCITHHFVLALFETREEPIP